MEQLYLTRRNLQTLINKLDRKAEGGETQLTLIKRDTTHPKYPSSNVICVTAVEDHDYYVNRGPGAVFIEDDPDARTKDRTRLNS